MKNLNDFRIGILCSSGRCMYMNSLNLYILTRYNGERVSEVENIISDRKEKLEIRDYEYKSLCSFVNLVMKENIEIELLDGFFYSYTIEYIGKEFDLLKIGKDRTVLNIELKSQMVEEEKIENQLIKNKYYLNPIADKLFLFTYVMETDEIFGLTKDDKLYKCDINSIIKVLLMIDEYLENDIERLFRAKDYLISPLNTPEIFLQGKYFLTQQQHNIKDAIINGIQENFGKEIYGITGTAGTGKTLLLFDLIRTISKNDRCCVIHCGVLCGGHEILNVKMNNVSIFSIKEIDEGIINNYDYIFVDEMHRIWPEDFDMIIKSANSNNKQLICSYDFKQVLSTSELKRNIPQKMKKYDNYKEYKLTDKIRTNKELMRFILNMQNINKKNDGYYTYENIDVINSNSIEEANSILSLYKKRGYVIIGYTKSIYNYSTIDCYVEDYDTHHIIGQEFDNVIVVMDENFKYDEQGKLISNIHPNPDFIFSQLLFQAVSRCREKLAILVCDNNELFEKLIHIKYRFDPSS